VRDGDVVAERCERASSSHAGLLPVLVREVLTHEPLARGDALAVSIGPGSFTGLRIGLSFAKGLAFACGLRVVGVPTLDAFALAAQPWTGRLCVALDARKQEVYAAVYEDEGRGIARVAGPMAIAPRALAAAVGPHCSFVGDAVEAYGTVLREVLGGGATLLASAAHPPRASAVARLAAARLANDPDGDDLVALEPVYVRPPEAELTQSTVSPSVTALDPAGFVDKVPLTY
jgi:tRNA threonylcarbamoyladenosine biosynthesis protein TsaB